MSSTYTNLIYHVVFSTKNRKALILPQFQLRLHGYLGGIINKAGGRPLAVGGMPDHVHLVMKLNADHSLSQVVRRVKANSSRWVNEQWGHQGRFGWQTGYGAFTVSESELEKVIHYVKTQPERHRIVGFQEEYREMLKRHRIRFDEENLWG